MNAHERAARMSKVAKVTGFIAQSGIRTDADTLAALPERGWQLLARGAGVRPLSVASRNLVIDAFRPAHADNTIFVGLS